MASMAATSRLVNNASELRAGSEGVCGGGLRNGPIRAQLALLDDRPPCGRGHSVHSVERVCLRFEEG